MLRLNPHCLLIPSASLAKLGICYGSSTTFYHRAEKLSLKISVNALKDGTNGGTSSFPGQSWNPGSEIEVPFEQRPVNAFSSLKDGALYSWAELRPGAFFLRLGVLWLATFTAVGIPVSAASFDLSREPLRFVPAAGTGSLFLVSLIVFEKYFSGMTVN